MDFNTKSRPLLPLAQLRQRTMKVLNCIHSQGLIYNTQIPEMATVLINLFSVHKKFAVTAYRNLARDLQPLNARPKGMTSHLVQGHGGQDQTNNSPTRQPNSSLVSLVENGPIKTDKSYAISHRGSSFGLILPIF